MGSGQSTKQVILLEIDELIRNGSFFPNVIKFGSGNFKTTQLSYFSSDTGANKDLRLMLITNILKSIVCAKIKKPELSFERLFVLLLHDEWVQTVPSACSKDLMQTLQDDDTSYRYYAELIDEQLIENRPQFAH